MWGEDWKGGNLCGDFRVREFWAHCLEICRYGAHGSDGRGGVFWGVRPCEDGGGDGGDGRAFDFGGV